MNPRQPALWLLVPGAATAALGCLALLGWILERPLLASFGADLIPMSPSAAAMLVMYGLAICWRVWAPASGSTVWIGRGAGGAGILIALLFLVMLGFNVHLSIEHLGLKSDSLVQGAITGHMSPLTAFCFLLVGVAFLTSLSRSATRPLWHTGVTLGTTGVLLAVCYVFLLAYCFGEPLLYRGGLIPPALNTILALSILGITLLALADHPAGLLDESSTGKHRTALAFGLIFVTLAAAIIAGGYIYYRHFEKQFRAEIERQLSVIAELKVAELTLYRDERLSDAAIFFQNPAFSSLVRSCFAQTPDTHASDPAILDW
ncbi:MAG: DUF202 domain-containing protein [Verrucomicrobiota bacterium]